MSKKKLTYETAMEELQNIVTAIQEEKVSMDDLTDKVQQAAKLIQYCKERLRSTEEELKGFLD